MWAQFLPQIQERVAVLETAAEAFAAGRLSKQHEAAKTAAHKLAGVLGTFGLTQGTVLARERRSCIRDRTGRTPRWRDGWLKSRPNCG